MEGYKLYTLLVNGLAERCRDSPLSRFLRQHRFYDPRIVHRSAQYIKGRIRQYAKAVMLDILSLVKPQPFLRFAQPQPFLRFAQPPTQESFQHFKLLLKQYRLVIARFAVSENEQIQLLYGVSDAFIEKHALFATFYPAMVNILYNYNVVTGNVFLKWEAELKKQTGDCWADLAKRIEGLFDLIKRPSDDEE